MSKAKDVFTEVANRITNSNDEVKEAVIAARVKSEVGKRTALLDKALVTLEKLQGELKSTDKPSRVDYDEAGTVLHKVYDKKTLDAVKKCKEKLAKLDGAIDAAVSEADKFEELSKVLQKVGG